MDGRRDLVFDRLDSVMSEVERLMDGHACLGDWTFGQVLHHLALTIRITAGRDRPPAVEPDPETSRAFDVRRRLFFRAGRFPDNVEVPMPSLLPPRDADPRAEAESLGTAIRRFEESEGTFPAHPLLGPLSKTEWDAFHRIHCAHHLGFVRPGEDQPGPDGATSEGTSR